MGIVPGGNGTRRELSGREWLGHELPVVGVALGGSCLSGRCPRGICSSCPGRSYPDLNFKGWELSGVGVTRVPQIPQCPGGICSSVTHRRVANVLG